jgi:hypothetical protein
VIDAAAAPDQAAPSDMPTRVVLEHPVFLRVSGISFRRSPTDGAATMVMPFGEREASIPLSGLRHEFNITDDTPDGQMLNLVAEALFYVTALVPGEALPAEVTTGDASWSAGVLHRHRAEKRLRVGLVRWFKPAAVDGAGGDERCAERLERDPELRTMLQNAMRRAAEQLGLTGSDDILARLELLAAEFAFIEVLRDELLLPVKQVRVQCKRYAAANPRLEGRRKDTLSRMVALHGKAEADLQTRFDAMDALVVDMLGLLAEPESQIAFLRSNRNVLHRTRLGWQGLLARWTELEPGDDTALWGVIMDTYQFLAQRHLPYTEWPSFSALRGGAQKAAGMAW